MEVGNRLEGRVEEALELGLREFAPIAVAIDNLSSKALFAALALVAYLLRPARKPSVHTHTNQQRQSFNGETLARERQSMHMAHLE